MTPKPRVLHISVTRVQYAILERAGLLSSPAQTPEQILLWQGMRGAVFMLMLAQVYTVSVDDGRANQTVVVSDVE